jgi:hypothetical protein
VVKIVYDIEIQKFTKKMKCGADIEIYREIVYDSDEEA